MSLILNKSQAEAIYNAMCALSNVNAVCLIDIKGDSGQEDIGVNGADGDVVVRVGWCGRTERYADQSAFATAYGLQQD